MTRPHMYSSSSYLHNLRLDRHWPESGRVCRGWYPLNGRFPESRYSGHFTHTYMWTLGNPKNFWIQICHPYQTSECFQLPLVRVYIPKDKEGFDLIAEYRTLSDGSTIGVVDELDNKMFSGDFPKETTSLWKKVMAGYEKDLHIAEESLIQEYAGLKEEETSWQEDEYDYEGAPEFIMDIVDFWKNFRLSDDTPLETLEAYARMANAWDYYYAANGGGFGDVVVESERRIERLLDIVDSMLDSSFDWSDRARLLNCLRLAKETMRDSGNDEWVRYINDNEKWVATNVVNAGIEPDRHIIRLFINLRLDWKRLPAPLVKAATQTLKEYLAKENGGGAESLEIQYSSGAYIKRLKNRSAKFLSELDGRLEKMTKSLYAALEDAGIESTEEEMLRLSEQVYICMNLVLYRLSYLYFRKGLRDDDEEAKDYDRKLIRLRSRIETVIRRIEFLPALFNLTAAAVETAFFQGKRTTIADHSSALQAEDEWMEKAWQEGWWEY